MYNYRTFKGEGLQPFIRKEENMRSLKGKSGHIRGVVFAVTIICAFYSAAHGAPWAGSGAEGDPYLIYDACDMQAIGADSNYWDAHFKLMADINLIDYNESNFNIIGEYPANPFTGVFDGNGHTVSNLSYNSPGTSFVGIFSYISGSNAEVRDVIIVATDVNAGADSGALTGLAEYCSITGCDVIDSKVCGGGEIGGLTGYNFYGEIKGCTSVGTTVIGSQRVGGLVGENYYGIITDCCSTGDVNGNATVGGLAGLNYEGSIRNCYSGSTVNSSYQAGGLAGYNSDNGIISDCGSSGTINGISDAISIGGLAGSNSGNISRCYSTGTVNGYCRIGGLSGYNRGSISNCYSKGDVNGTDDVGGLVGFCYDGSNISNCYSTGNVSGSSTVGGLIGLTIGHTSIEVTNCYSTGIVSGTSYVGGLVGEKGFGNISGCYFLITSGPDNGAGTPLTDEQMKQRESFVGWDFVGESANGTDDVWRMCVDGVEYPKLWWEFNTGDFVCPDGVDFADFAVLAMAWMLENGEEGYNPRCDISEPADERIDMSDLEVFTENWLGGD